MRQHVLKNGLILGLTVVIFQLVTYIFELYNNQYLGWGIYILIILLVFYSIRSFRDKMNGGFITFGQAFGLGTMIVLVGTAISSFFSFIYMQFIDPGMVDTIKELQLRAMQEQNIPDEQMEMSIKMMKVWMKPWIMAVSGLLANMVMGTIINLILAGILQRKPIVQ